MPCDQEMPISLNMARSVKSIIGSDQEDMTEPAPAISQAPNLSK